MTSNLPGTTAVTILASSAPGSDPGAGLVDGAVVIDGTPRRIALAERRPAAGGTAARVVAWCEGGWQVTADAATWARACTFADAIRSSTAAVPGCLVEATADRR